MTPLDIMNHQSASQNSSARFVLGTVQLGLSYGVANQDGMPSLEEAALIVNTAIQNGVREIDTARLYGESEARLGSILTDDLAKGVHVITKLDHLAELDETSTVEQVRSSVEKSIYTSVEKLALGALDTVLIHKAFHRTRYNGAIWERLCEFKQEGLIKNLGQSAQTAQEAIDAIKDEDVRHIQLPYNLLDWRWKEAGVPELAQVRTDLTIHSRSTYLQGLLLLKDAQKWPTISDVDAAKIIQGINTCVQELNRESAHDLCLAYVRAQAWIDGVVVGVETNEQLLDNLKVFDTPPLTAEEIQYVDNVLGRWPETLLNPVHWSN